MVSVLLVLAATALSGCVGFGGDAELDPGPAEDAGDMPTLPQGLEMEGAEVLSYNESSVTWHWEGAIGPGFWTPAAGAVGDSVEVALDAPGGLAFRIEAVLEFNDNSRTLLLLRIADENGGTVCSDGQGVTAAGVSPPPLTCTATVAPRQDAARWTMAVESTVNGNDPLPLTAEVTIRTVPPSLFLPPRAVAHSSDGQVLEVGGPMPVVETVEVGARAWEPTLGITRDGTIFYQGYGGNFLPPLLRSADNGTTWERVTPQAAEVNRHAISFDPYVHVDRDTGRVFTIDYQIQTAACHELSFSDDHGQSWTTTTPCGHQDFQKLWTGPPATSTTIGYPNVVYICSISGGLGSPYSFITNCSKSLDGGITFVPTGTPPFLTNPAAPTAGPAKGMCFAGAMPGAVAPDGTLYLVKGWCDEVYVAISQDEGATWQRIQVSHNGIARERIPPPFYPVTNEVYPVTHTTSSVAVDKAGNVYVAWIAEDRLPYLSYSVDGGASWSDARMLAHPNVTEANHPAIDVGAPGRVAVSYMASIDSTFPQSGLETDYADVPWTGYIAVSADALADDPLWMSAPVRPVDDPLVVGVCALERCVGAGDFFDVEIGPDGVPWAAFVDVHERGGNIGMGLLSRMVGGPNLMEADA